MKNTMQDSTLYGCEIKPMEGVSDWQTYDELRASLEEVGGTVHEQQVSHGVKTLQWEATREDGVSIQRTWYVGAKESLEVVLQKLLEDKQSSLAARYAAIPKI
jgi:hypothetical protein